MDFTDFIAKVLMFEKHQWNLICNLFWFNHQNNQFTHNILILSFFTDLQLAAELGKTLLERNKELENLLRAHQRKCEDQKQEIEVSYHYLVNRASTASSEIKKNKKFDTNFVFNGFRL